MGAVEDNSFKVANCVQDADTNLLIRYRYTVVIAIMYVLYASE